jgi:hypothetical protein
MDQNCTIGILSDVHYASRTEQAKGPDYEFRDVKNPLVRFLLKGYRHFVWLRDPLSQNHLLEKFIALGRDFDYVIANGDYSCDTGFCGLSDDAAFESAQECLGKLRQAFGPRFHATFGDHELGKKSLLGDRGGMRLASWHRATEECALKPFWRVDVGRYVLIGVVSSLIALPAMEQDIISEDHGKWERLRELHLHEIRGTFRSLQGHQRIILFCHDPTALPFLARRRFNPVSHRLSRRSLAICIQNSFCGKADFWQACRQSPFLVILH